MLISHLLLLFLLTACGLNASVSEPTPFPCEVSIGAPQQASGSAKFERATVAFEDKFADFHLQASAETPIKMASLSYFYYVNSAPYTKTTSFESPQKEVVLDMRAENDFWLYGDGLGRVVDYRWILTDAEGNISTSPLYTQVFQVRNAEYEWKVVASDHFRIYYYGAAEKAVRDLIAPASEAVLPIVSKDFCVTPPTILNIHFFATHEAYLRASQRTATAGIANLFGMLISPININSADSARMTVAHELTHNLHSKSSHSNMGPNWFFEGLAAYEESKFGATSYANDLSKSLERDALLPLVKLESSNRQDPFTNSMIYAEGYSMVKFLYNNYGKEKMLALIQEMARPKNLNAAMQVVYGKGWSELEKDWRATLK